MHLYFVTRGASKYTRRFIEELENKYYEYKNKKTGKRIGVIQLMPREVKTWECVFPESEKEDIKKFILSKQAAQDGAAGHMGIHFVKFKKDKFIDGVEQL